MGCLWALAFLALLVSGLVSGVMGLFGYHEEAAAPAPSPTPIVQAQPGYAPRAELVRLPNQR
jgi:hypothetical protein